MTEHDKKLKNLSHIERIRIKFGFKRKSPEQKQADYLAKIDASEAREINQNAFAITTEKLESLATLAAHAARITREAKVGA